jgi:methionyl-tRNA formyltransferase
MRIAIIGRTELLYDTALRFHVAGHQIGCILTAKEAPEYTRTAADFRELADTCQIPFAEGGRIAAHADFLREAEADIAVSINYTGVVPQSVIDLFPLGVLNAHGGDLPRYRGNACQAWAILNGEERIGLCIHRMIGGELDSGDIIARDYLAIDHTTKVTRVWEWMSVRTPELMLEAVHMLNANPGYVLEQQSKDPKQALRCYPRKPEDGRIDWTKPAIDVLRLINASNKPYSGAFCDFEGNQLIIWDAELVVEDEMFFAVPGQVTKIGDVFIEVACGEGKIRVLSVEYREQVSVATLFIQSIRKRFT